LEVVKDLSLLDGTTDTDLLAAALIAADAIPVSEPRDAFHIAIAATNGVKYLLTWNFKQKKTKGHAQQLGWSQRNSESNAKTIGARTASDGEFVFSTTAKASKDEASHDCRGRIRAEFERNSIDWYVPLPQSNSFVPSQRRLKAESYPVEPSADVCKMPNTQLAR
jgi:Arc/MetJ family transcription regulator